MFDSPQQAAAALQAAAAGQVRVGQVWEHRGNRERVLVVDVDHDGGGPDGTVFVRSLDDPSRGFSPGDFRDIYRKTADRVDPAEDPRVAERRDREAVRAQQAAARMRAWADAHPESDTQGVTADEWDGLARAALGLEQLPDDTDD